VAATEPLTRFTFTLPEGVAIGELPTEARSPSALGESGQLLIESEDVMPTLRALSAWATEHRYDIADLLVRRPALEDVYLGLTARPK
jgi:hypothetical protein